MELIRETAPRTLVGGKGAQLLELKALGLPVPSFFVIPVGAEELDAEALLVARRELDPGPVAVRSSALGEDAASASFAGQFDTVLCVHSDDALWAAIETCRRSIRSERVQVYCQQHGIDPSQTAMAVVVQEMFPSHTSGVMFTADPAAPSEAATLISAAWGLGEGVVGGHADTDEYRVVNTTISSTTVDKRVHVIAKEGGGTVEAEVPEALRTRPCLSDAQVLELATLGLRLESHFGRPQDVEWAFDESGKLAVLQTRPLTAVGPRTGRVYTWDNSNIIESYSGITTPLTYSFARTAYEVVYRQFCELMGVPDAQIAENSAVFKSMIGLVRGRVFYRLDNWYQVVSLLPGAKHNKRFMEKMMGVKKEADLEETGGGRGAGRLRIAYLVWRMVRALMGLGRMTVSFKGIFKEAYGQYHHIDLDTLGPQELVAAYRDLERRLLLNWKAPIVNDFYAMIFFGVLEKMGGGQHNDLLCGEPGMESTLPTREAMAMAEHIRTSERLTGLFETHDNHGVLAHVSEHPDLANWLASYLDRFGDRCMEELKLETSPLRDDPTFVIATLRNYISRPDLTIASLDEREHRVRSEAEAAISVPAHKRPLFNWILRRARRHVRERENLRFARTRIFGLVRRIFRSLGGHLTRGGVVDQPDDVFYLTTEEVFGLVEGSTVTTDARGLVSLRRREFERYRRLPAPSDRFETRGGVHLGNIFESNEPVVIPEGDVLSGLGCAPGIVQAQVKVVHSPRDVSGLSGRIMACERTDPGWVPLFPTVSGLLVERGSALSHSAIVAREFGIPTVVGIPGLLQRVSDGQWVELNGKSGHVRLDVDGHDT